MGAPTNSEPARPPPSLVAKQTCANALGSLISVRCSILGACLLILLACLACLAAIELGELLARTAGPHRYRVSNAQSAQLNKPRLGSFQRRDPEDQDQRRQRARPAAAGAHDDDDDGDGDDGDDDGDAAGRARHAPPPMIGNRDDPINELLRRQQEPGAGTNRLQKWERQRQAPLLERAARAAGAERHLIRELQSPAGELCQSPLEYLDESDEPELEPGPEPALLAGPAGELEPAVLARADLRLVERQRPQSPHLKRVERAPAEPAQDRAQDRGQPATRPIKSALKKSPSGQHLETADDDSGSFHFRRDSRDSRDTDADSLDEYAEKLRQSNSLLRQKSLQREQPTRRSLLSVRFAE